MKRAYIIGVALVSVLIGSCQLGGPECRDGFCRVPDEPDLWVYQRALMAEDDPNFKAVEVFDDHLVFTGTGPAEDFAYRVGDILISSPYSEPAFMRKVSSLEYRGHTLVAWTEPATMFDVVRGKLRRKVSLQEGLHNPIVTDGRGRVLKVERGRFGQQRQPLHINVELPAGYFITGDINYDEAGKSIVFSDCRIGKEIELSSTDVQGGKCNDSTQCETGFSCQGDDNPDDGRMDGECTKSVQSETFQFGILFDGRITPAITADFDADIDWWWPIGIDKLKVVFGGQMNLDFPKMGIFGDYENSFNFNFKLVPAVYISTPIPIGPIVIPAGIRLALFAGADASLEISGELTSHVTANSSITLGAEYRDGDWHNLSDASFTATAEPPSLCINGNVHGELFLKPELMFEIIQKTGVGPAIFLKPTLGADIKLAGERCKELFFKVPVGFDMKTEIFDQWCEDRTGLEKKFCDVVAGIMEDLHYEYNLYEKTLYKKCAKKVCEKDHGGNNTENVYWFDEGSGQLVPDALCGLVTRCDKEDPAGTKVCCGGECVELCGQGNLKGLVVDKADETKKIAGAQVKLTDSDGNVVFQGTTGADGIYQVNDLDAGWYDLEINAQGYYPFSASVQIRSQETTFVAKLEAIPLECNAAGTISGVVTDATTNAPVADAHIVIRKMSDGTQVDSTTTDQNGHYQTKPLPADYYSVEVIATGYARATVENVSACGYDDGNPDNDDTEVNISIPPAEGKWHVVLHWGDAPKDLDLHAKLPDGTHIFYRSGCRGDRNAPPYAELDVDVRNGHGPETITITQPQTGTYQFFVHNYGGQNDENDSGSLGASGARLVLYNPAGDTVRTFNVPAGCSQYFWYAFNLKFDGNGNATVEPINNCGGGSNPADYEDPPICDLP